jgi:hypothetical protein
MYILKNYKRKMGEVESGQSTFTALQKGEQMMYLNAIRAKVQPDKLEEFVQKWRDVYGLVARGMPQLQQGYCSADRASGTLLAVWLWSQKPDEAQMRQASEEFSSQTADLLVEPPTREWYEVLQQI